MHEETLMDVRLVVEVRDGEGVVVERSVGASSAELLEQHRAGLCSVTCSWCHQALADEIGEDAAVAVMYERSFGKPMPGGKAVLARSDINQIAGATDAEIAATLANINTMIALPISNAGKESQ